MPPSSHYIAFKPFELVNVKEQRFIAGKRYYKRLSDKFIVVKWERSKITISVYTKILS
jgi:hypothetical protein